MIINSQVLNLLRHVGSLGSFLNMTPTVCVDKLNPRSLLLVDYLTTLAKLPEQYTYSQLTLSDCTVPYKWF